MWHLKSCYNNLCNQDSKQPTQLVTAMESTFLPESSKFAYRLASISVTSRILKELHSEVAPMLTNIFNSSLREVKVPDDWRNASVSPVYKKGAKTKAENYRPISLTCVCCKVMEHVITSNIMAYLDKHQLLHSNQHGFSKKLSCETQLIQFVQDISDTLNESGQTDIIVMDFSKAFDKVDHKRLLLKLHRFGINNDLITWIGSFLSNRTQ